MTWHGEPLAGFDLETTGTEPLEARIVTAAVVEVRGGEVIRQRTWLADPGIRIPAQASAVHGISSERAASEGRPARDVVAEIAQVLMRLLGARGACRGVQRAVRSDAALRGAAPATACRRSKRSAR